MNMKKKIAPLLAAALVAANAAPVMATDDTNSGSVAEGNYQNVSKTSPSGSTTVVANVAKTDPGAVTYTISVPSYVDFGSLQRNEASMQGGNVWDRNITGQVTLTDVTGLDAMSQRIAVLVEDTKNGTNGFQMDGASGAALSNKKTLNYIILAGEQDLTDTTVYPNGFVIGAFAEQDNTVNLTFKLNQNQMTGELDQWEGTYQGTLTFYSKVAGLNDYN